MRDKNYALFPRVMSDLLTQRTLSQILGAALAGLGCLLAIFEGQKEYCSGHVRINPHVLVSGDTDQIATLHAFDSGAFNDGTATV